MMTRRFSSRHARQFGSLLMLGLTLGSQVGRADPACSADDFAKTVDSSGAALRQYNQEAAPRLQAKLKALAAKKGWTDQEFEEQAITYLQDERISKLDETANGLLAKIDTLGRQDPSQTADCARLEELKTAGIELMAVMKAKTTYLMARVDTEVAPPSRSAAVAPTNPAPVVPPPVATDHTAQGDHAAPVRKETAPPAPATPPRWSTTTDAAKQAAAAPGASLANGPAVPPANQHVAMVPAPAPVPPLAGPTDDSYKRPGGPVVLPDAVFQDDGYSIDEIRDATKGFFGTISTGLASVIEHTFQKIGRPTGYVLGQEGGGAFLGGLRYGDGQLYLHRGGTQKIYWHGPSVGFDVGAAGARTLFLIYKLREPEDLFRTFTGIDGSAFVVGGVGLTLLGGGDMVLAPIRSGLGVRLGANIGYLRFTPTQTWNPF